MIKILILEITNRCNAKCPFCYYGKKDKLDIEPKVLDSVEKNFSKLRRLQISGGEPLLNKKLPSILARLSKISKETVLLTNGYFVNKNILKKLKNNGLSAIQISLDGLQKTHDSLRGRNFFNKAINAISLASDLNLKPRIMFTVSRQNRSDLINLYLYLKNYTKLDSFNIEKMIAYSPSGRKNVLTREEFLSLMQEFTKYIDQVQLPIKVNYCFDEKQIKKFCKAGKDTVTIGFNGDVFICAKQRILMGNLLAQNIGEILGLNEENIASFNPEGCL